MKKIDYSKVIAIMSLILAFLGLFLVIGTVGGVDYADEIGEQIAVKDFLPQIVVGIVMMIPAMILFKD